MNESFIMKDMKKYRNFPGFLYSTHQLFNEFPQVAQLAAREMLTVNNVDKKAKQKIIMGEIRKKIGLLKMARIAWNGWRSVK
jgi:electron transfer flavoprotein-quinone oxidoreductase